MSNSPLQLILEQHSAAIEDSSRLLADLDGPRLTGKVLSGGGDWNAVRPDGVVHVFAKYSIQASDGTPISITNEGFGRASQSGIKAIFDGTDASMIDGDERWYTKTWPRFEVAPGNWDWLNTTCFIGDLLPPTSSDRHPDKPNPRIP